MFRINVLVFLFLNFIIEISVAETLVDPTRPIVLMSDNSNLQVSSHNIKGLRLSSIVINSLNQGYAIIDDKTYRLGEKVQGVKIIKINKDYLLLSNGRKLVVFKSIIKKQGS